MNVESFISNKKFSPGDVIFTNGAFITAVNLERDGVKQWRWIVTSFEDDSFLNGEIVNPAEQTDKFDKILSYYENESQ